ncbi:Ankyrin repeat-containing domain protein [Beauveria brongniartii RCEF 3172]|uniref:Ankyrin repeat-containing domain protein n=1 Tax=Beauveria brongniartii RCEF 3172 TaxID=1081107 RepID=A0A162M1J9_9HYPO|nr:Ankyrin repeat-containing domain protein [Beauveria brongniartii RCEF 3172]
MAILTCARAFVRRGLVVSPSSEVLQQDFELDWFAKSFENPNPSWMNKQTWFNSQREQKLSLSRSGTCRPNTQDIEGSETCDRYAQHILSIRLRLAKLSDWRGPASNEAILLAEAVEAVASELLPHSRERFVGKFEVVLKGKICSFLLNLELVQGSWRARADEFEALLSLWLSTFVKEEGEPKVNQLNDNDSWLRVQRARDTGLRILGHAPEAYALLRDLRLWLPEDVEEILEIEDDAHTDFIFEDEQVIDVANHRVVGDGASRVVNKAQISTRFRICRAIDMRIVDFDKGDSAFDSMKPRSYEYILGRDSGSTFGSSDYRLPTEDIEESWLLSGLRREFNLNGSFLAIRSSDSLEHLFARQILSSLVKSFARERVCRDGKAASSNSYPESSCKGDSDWRTCEMENIKVSKVVRKLVNTGFLSLADAHLDIVAALSIAQHLPSPSIIFRHLKHKMNEAFSNSSYDRFEDAFMSLLELAVTFETPGTTLAPQALAICHYYFEMLTYAFTVGSREVRYDDPLKDCVERLEPVVQEMLYPKTESSLPGPWSVFADQFSIWWTRTECPTMPKHMRTERLDAERFQLSKQHISAVMPDPDGTGHDNDPEYVERMTPDVFQWTPVHYLAAIGVRRAVREPYPYYRPNTCFNSVDIFGLSPLHYACSRGRTSAVEYLLIRGALVDVEQENGISPMHLAAASGNTEVVQLLLVELTKKEFQQRNVRGKTKGSTATDFNGRVPIHWATMKGHVGIVKLLSVDMNVTDKFGLSCLHLAVLYQHRELVHWLVEQSGCNVDALDATQRSPLQLAVTQSNVEMVQLLVKRGAHIDVADGTPKSYTPFHYAVKNRNLEIFDSLLGDDETRKHLGRLSARQAVLMKCSSGYNALFCVARKLIRNEEDLITAGAMARDVIDLMDSSDVNMQVDGLTALHWACLTASSAVVESLLHGEGKGRASIKIKDSKGRMPLDFIREKLLVANYDHQDDLQEFNVRWRETEDIKYRLGSSFGFFALGIAPEFDESEMEEFEKGPITYDARQGIMGIERMLKRYGDLYI